jgi:hypothetical protein
MQDHAAASQTPGEDMAAPNHTLMYAPRPSPRRPARWAKGLLIVAWLPPAVVVLGFAAAFGDLIMAFGLMLAAGVLMPLGIACSLIGIVSVRRHLNGLALALFILALLVDLVLVIFGARMLHRGIC